MKRLLLVLVALGGLVYLSDSVLEACGSKFLVSSRGARYQRVLASIEPTSILWYWQQDENTEEEDRWNPDAEKMLASVGHTVDVTYDADAFLGAARDGGFDVLLLPIDEARRLQPELTALPPGSAVVPVLQFPTRSQYSQAREEYGIVMKLPTTGEKMLAALEKGRRSLSQ
jgi:hypothetical protein